MNRQLVDYAMDRKEWIAPGGLQFVAEHFDKLSLAYLTQESRQSFRSKQKSVLNRK